MAVRSEFFWGDPVPSGWKLLGRWCDGYTLQNGGLRVIVDCSEKADNQLWLHVSYSRAHWTPNHADTCEIKRAFLGERYAYAVFPPSERYVNIHKHCLHLWARLDGKAVLPEFADVVEGVGLSI